MALSVALPPVAGGCAVGGTVGRGSRLEDDVFGSLALLLGSSQPSPSPSASSESSGIGSLGSLKSDSLPSSPHSVDKKLLQEPLAQGKRQEPRVEGVEEEEGMPTAEHLRVMYGGRDVLNMMSALNDSRWQYRPAYLPQSNPALFFENRSQYHRLGSFAQPQFVTESCRACGYESVVAVTE